MLQIRISNFDGSNPVILENAEGRSYSKAINSADEGVSFTIAKNSPKAAGLNPDIDGYTKRWEVWDTEKNERLNYGPITSIEENGPNWKVQGLGRSALLADFYSTIKTFYGGIEATLDATRMENLAVEPRTITLVPTTKTSAEQTTVFGSSVNIDDKYYPLSKQTKDLAIDDDTGLTKPGEVEPTNTFYATDSFWSGMSRSDTHITDLGDIYPINKINLYLPTWGGPERGYNRAYTYEVAFATDTGTTTNVQGRDFGSFVTLWSTPNPNRATGGANYYVGYDSSNTLTVSKAYQYLQPVMARYIRVRIINTHAWFGTHFDNEPSVDGWAWQCDPNYQIGDIPQRGNKPGAMTEEINTRTLEPENDCHASIKEIQIGKNIIDRDTIKALGLQRIDNNNLQITYAHTPDASETVTTADGFRKFEPGSFFRNFRLTYSGASSNYTKFFASDCTNCFPDGFHFGIMDQYNSMVYMTDSTGGTVAGKLGAYTRQITTKGASNATVTQVDCWPAVLDQLSWGGSYSYTEVTGDTATIHFRGESFKWYATVPADKTGANVTLQIRHKNTSGTWTSWSTLSTFTLPSDISNKPVFHIPYEDGYFLPDTVYEIKIINNGGYCSIDSIEGYWSASLTDYNEDSLRIRISHPENIKQIYDKRFSGGSMYKILRAPEWIGFNFVGDRVIILSARGRNHGKIRILLRDYDLGMEYDPGTSNHVFIPGGDPVDGSLVVDLNTGKRGNEVTQFVVFDSNDYFPNGLKWGSYNVGVFMWSPDVDYYTTNVLDYEFDSFVSRCKDCKSNTSDSITVPEPVFLDGIIVHELLGLSVSFTEETNLEILKSVTEALQVEWDINESGLRVEPRIGRDTFEYLREGHNTLVEWQIVNDIQPMASMLLSHGSDIDGLPLFTVTEDKETRRRLGRTVMRQQDFRGIANYLQLIGLSRTELRKRAYPQKRITVRHIGTNLDLDAGDSFMLWTEKMGEIRVRIENKRIDEADGRTYTLECVRWPLIS